MVDAISATLKQHLLMLVMKQFGKTAAVFTSKMKKYVIAKTLVFIRDNKVLLY